MCDSPQWPCSWLIDFCISRQWSLIVLLTRSRNVISFSHTQITEGKQVLSGVKTKARSEWRAKRTTEVPATPPPPPLPNYSRQPVIDRLEKIWNLSPKKKKMQKNLHSGHHFLKHTIIIYPRYENSMIQKKQDIQKTHSYFLGTTKHSASLDCTAPIDRSIKVAM